MYDDVVAGLGELADRIAARDLSTRDGAEVGAELLVFRRVIDRLEAQWLRQATAFDESLVWRADGAASAAEWIAQRSNLVDQAAVARGIGTVAAVEALPATAEALANGEIGVEHARQIAAVADDALARGARGIDGPILDPADEHALLDAARQASPRRLRPLIRDWQNGHDPATGVERARRQHARRGLRRWTRPDDGMYCLAAELAPDAGAIVDAALEAWLRHLRSADDPRTADQQRADALVALCQRADGGGTGGPERPQVMVVMDLETLARPDGGPAARLGNGEQIDAPTARRWCCDADVSRVLTGPDSAVVDLGRSRRTVSKAQRRLLEVRDGGCVFPDCGAPSLVCQAHHLQFWRNGGPTDVDNLALVCWQHHHAVHEGGWTLTRAGRAGWQARRNGVTRSWHGPPQRHRSRPNRQPAQPLRL